MNDKRYAELTLTQRMYCYMPNTKCDNTSTSVREVDGTWLPVCSKHKEVS